MHKLLLPIVLLLAVVGVSAAGTFAPAFPPSALASVTVQAVGVNGKAVSAATVTAHPTGSSAAVSASCITDRNGICTLMLHYGSYRLSAARCPLFGAITVTVSAPGVGFLQAMKVIQMSVQRIPCPLGS